MPTYKLKPEYLEKLRNKFSERQLTKAINSLDGRYTQYKRAMCNPEDPKSACCLMAIAQDVDGAKFKDAVVSRGSYEISHARPSAFLSAKRLSVYLESMGSYCILVIFNDIDLKTAIGFISANDQHLTHPQIGELLKGNEITIN